MDRDTRFTAQFRETLKSADVKSIRLPPFSPNLNAYIERFFRSLKSECVHRMIFFGERSLRNAVKQYLEHYHTERNHQGLENQLIDPPPDEAETNRDETLPLVRRERLGGMLSYYHRAA